MSENDLKRIWDAWDACRRILEFTKGLSEEAFQDSEMVQSAVERQFEICGEALGHLRGEEEIERLVPDLHKIVGLRNRLIHGYDSIDYEMLGVWWLRKFLSSIGNLLQFCKNPDSLSDYKSLT